MASESKKIPEKQEEKKVNKQTNYPTNRQMLSHSPATFLDSNFRGAQEHNLKRRDRRTFSVLMVYTISVGGGGRPLFNPLDPPLNL